MNRAQSVRIALAACLSVLVSGAALADITTFNTAVKAGNYKAAAAEAKTVWATWDMADHDTAIVAREFGFASYVAGDYAAARSYGQFLKDKGATLATPDDQPATSRVLLAASSFRISANDATRKDLFEAVKAREAAPGLDSISMLASEALYKADWASGRWRDAADSGMSAYNILQRGGDALMARAFEARTTAAAGDFLAQRDKTDYDRMVDTHEAIIDAINKTNDPKRRENLVCLAFSARAWSNAIYNFFDSVQQTGSSIPVKVKHRDLSDPDQAFFASVQPSAAEWCAVDTDANVMRYPSSPLFNGMVGTVIMRFDVDDSGRITRSDVLAAVPARHFSEAVADAVPKIKFRPAAKAKPGCALARNDYVVTFTFRIQ